MVNKSKKFSEVKPAATVRKHGEAAGLNQRKNVRVDDVLKIDYRKIPQKDYETCENKPEIILQKIFGKPFEAPKIEDVSLELLYMLIYQANQKIDRILDMLESKDAEKYESMNNECVNISGSGMRFIANQSFSIGDIVALRIFLPLASKTWINILGKVVSVTESGAENRYEVTVKFKELTESDREIIIRYVFKRQRELLRLTSDSKSRETLNFEP
ncbi:MAG: PilZ domain-containing protein [Thermodesulfobacteriota bacterium]|nr:PilZ domain-containing protein [Thermodesulfobacteriota bacterium]